MKCNQTAKQIIHAVGGKRNIEKTSICATRLRMKLKNEAKIDHEALKAIDPVIASFQRSDEFQILLREGLAETYQCMIRPSVGKKLFGDFWP